MGREAIVQAAYDGRSGEARVLLEAEGVILRAPITGRIPRSAISGLEVQGESLVGEGPRGRFELALGASEAAKWKAALEKTPPTLREKLGLRSGVGVWIWGDMEGAELSEALKDVVRLPAENAELRLIRAGDASALDAGLAAGAASSAPVWVVHGKGRGVFGEAAVRAIMRERGFIDTKVSAVSAELSATRYSRR